MAYEEENKYNRLEELSGSNYQIVEGEPDISDRDVIDAQGRIIGEVDDVLFDPQTRDVRYIIVDLSENELDIDVDKKVLIPIGLAELPEQEEENGDLEQTDAVTEIDGRTGNVNEYTTDEDEVDEYDDDDDDEEEEVVYLPTVTAEHLLALPAYNKDLLSPAYETSIRDVFETPNNEAVIAYHQDTFYTHEHFNNKIYPRNEQQASDELDRGDLGDSDNQRRDDDTHIL
jgi:hypothetical protein